MAKIVVVNTLPVPSGQASVNRILSYSKGLVECGDIVHVLSSSSSLDGVNEKVIDGINVYNFGKGKSISSLLKALLIIVRKIRKEKYDVVISTTNSLLLIYPLFLACKMVGAKFVQEKSEFPFVLMKKGIFRKLWGMIYVNTTYKLMDGIIVMTHPLYDYFKKKVRRNCKFIEMPMTVDSSRFDVCKTSSELGDYIAYCGNMSGNKDGIDNLIESFAIVESQCKTIKLLLIGGTNTPDEFLRLKQKVKNLNLNNVCFYGRAERTEIPVLLKNAKILALARPSSLQSTGGFPTKLGEYLSTGNPVVVTAVGDIPKFLDRNNSFIVPPDDNCKFAEAILEALRDEQRARKIGEQGRKLVDCYFDYRVQSKRLHSFLNSEL